MGVDELAGKSDIRKDPEGFLVELFKTAVASVSADLTLPGTLPPAPGGRLVVLAIGKAAPAMAAVVARHYGARAEGLVVTRYGHLKGCEASLRQFECREAGHPLPDTNGMEASRRVEALIAGLGPEDLVLALVSGGASALLPAPVAGVTLAEKIEITKQLLGCGATIGEINCVRKHLSRLKGGRLAWRAAPAKVVSLLVSDVVGDHPSMIASGPTVGDPTSLADAREVIERYGLAVSPGISAALMDPANETPTEADLAHAMAGTRVVASPQIALDAAAATAKVAGCKVIELGDAIEGEAGDIARRHASLAAARRADTAPSLLLSGGELTVTLGPSSGTGGANTEYALALAVALAGAGGVHAIACDTDGSDGSGNNAGATIGPDVLARAERRGVDAADYLARHDSYNFFEAAGGLVMTGPTNTNVNDFRAILVIPEGVEKP